MFLIIKEGLVNEEKPSYVPHVCIYSQRIWFFMPMQCEFQSLSFWNALKINTRLRSCFCICIFLYLSLTFHVISSPFHFSISEVILPPVQTFGICVGYTNRVQCCCNQAIHATQLSPHAGGKSHVTLSRGVPQGTNTCLRQVPSNITDEGTWRTLLLNLLLSGWAKLCQEPKSKEAKDSCTLQNSQNRVQSNLRAYFSGVFKVEANNTKLIPKGWHWSSPNHLKFHVLPSVQRLH